MMSGIVTTYGPDPNAEIRQLQKNTDPVQGLTVGKVVAVKVFDKKTRKAETRLALVFNEWGDSPDVLFLKPDAVGGRASADLAKLVCEKVNAFDKFKTGRIEEEANKKQNTVEEA